MGGKSRLFCKEIYYFDIYDITVHKKQIADENEGLIPRIFFYQSNCLIQEDEEKEDKRIHIIDWLSNEYQLISCSI